MLLIPIMIHVITRGREFIKEPRIIMKAVTKDFREMEYSGVKTLCCGAGGGLLADEKEWNELRIWTG